MANLSAADRKALEQDILVHVDDIYYSPRYYDDQYEYRHVNVPKQIVRWMPEGKQGAYKRSFDV
jgi:cyclin-dependent kinase regulatory subunit CKS1